ncbi:MAG: hypothetical protein V3S70_10945 [Gammaproteobacteria bacterium]
MASAETPQYNLDCPQTVYEIKKQNAAADANKGGGACGLHAPRMGPHRDHSEDPDQRKQQTMVEPSIGAGFRIGLAAAKSNCCSPIYRENKHCCLYSSEDRHRRVNMVFEQRHSYLTRPLSPPW